MKNVNKYLTILFSLALALTFTSCSSDDDNPETELPSYMEEKVPMRIGLQTFQLSLFDNATGQAFRKLLPMTILMEDVNANEKFYRLSQSLPGASANPGTIRNGDLMAYGGNGLVLFYKTFSTSYSYARIGTVNNPSGLQSALGSGTVTITFGEVIEISDATLTYNTNGATGGLAPDPVTEKEGTSVRLHNGEGVSRTGFTFGGWNTNAEGTGTNYAGGSNYKLNSDITLYAKWSTLAQSNTMKITVGATTFTATLADNPTAKALRDMLPMTVNMNEQGGYEKYYYLPGNLRTNTYSPGTIRNGDILLWGSNCLVLFYTTFQSGYSYTRIGSVDNPSGLQAALGNGNVTVTFEMQ